MGLHQGQYWLPVQQEFQLSGLVKTITRGVYQFRSEWECPHSAHDQFDYTKMLIFYDEVVEEDVHTNDDYENNNSEVSSDSFISMDAIDAY